MSRLTIADQRLCLRFSRPEKMMGILRNLDVPLDRILFADRLLDEGVDDRLLDEGVDDAEDGHGHVASTSRAVTMPSSCLTESRAFSVTR